MSLRALQLVPALWLAACYAPGQLEQSEETEPTTDELSCGCTDDDKPTFNHDDFFDIADTGGGAEEEDDEPLGGGKGGGDTPFIEEWEKSIQAFGTDEPTTPKPGDAPYKTAKVINADGDEVDALIPLFATAKDINTVRKNVIYPLRSNKTCVDGTTPCIELHNHFMGVPSVTDIMTMAADRQALYKKEKTYLDPKIFVNDILICKFFENHKKDDAGDDIGLELFQKPAPSVWALLKPMIDYTNIKKPKLKNTVTEQQAKDMIEMALNATNRTPFYDVYPQRGGFVESKEPQLITWRNYAVDVMQRLKDDSLFYTEQSFGIGKLSDPNVVSVGTVKKLRKEVGTNVMTPAKLPQDIRFLPMLNTRMLADVTRPIGEKEQRRLGGGSGVLMRSDVLGLDIAGPEAQSLVNFDAFKGAYVMLSRTARTRHRPMVFRPHVGEGSFRDLKAADCPAAGDFNVWCAKRNGDAIDFQIMAAKNISTVLGWITKLKRDPVWAGDWVQFRFGHVTQLTEEQAKDMVALKVGAEINPIGNLVTGALQPDCPDLRATPDRDNQAGMPEATILDKKHQMYQKFPLLLALYYGVPTELGTDAQSVMHTSVADQYARAQQVIDWYKAGKITLLIGGRPVVYKDLGKPQKADMDKRLDVQRLRDWAIDYWQQVRENDVADTQKPQTF